MFTPRAKLDKQATIDRIRDAAMALVAEKGVAETTVRDLAQAAGVSEGALYRHYETKEDLIRDLYRVQYGAFGQRLRALMAGEKTLKAKIAAVARFTCRMFDEDPVTYRFLLLAQHEVMRRFPADEDSPVAVLRDALAKARGETRVTNADLGVALWLGLLIQPAASIVNASLTGPLSRYAGDIAQACLRVLLK